MSCDAKYLIYGIQCSGCQEDLVAKNIGKTGDTLRRRLTVHRQQIRDARSRMLYVSGHIENCARNQSVKFKILPLYKMQNDSTSARKLKENNFIGLFQAKIEQAYLGIIHLSNFSICSYINPYFNRTICVTSLVLYNNVVAIDADVIYNSKIESNVVGLKRHLGSTQFTNKY